MTTSGATQQKPLWVLMEESLLQIGTKDLSGDSLEPSIQKMAKELDTTGFNVSCDGGNMIKLRAAAAKAQKAGKPFLKDFNAAIEALTLETAADAYAATTAIIDRLAGDWPDLKCSARRPYVIEVVENRKLDLLIAKAKSLPGDEGIRMLIEDEVDFSDIASALDITDEKVNEVNELIKKERAERARVAGLLEKVADKSNEEKVRHLFDNEVSEALIMEMAGVGQADIDAVKKAMEEEIAEKQRKAEEEAARKKAEAEGPALEDISPEDMTYFIDSIREIMEFSDQEKEIRVMCEQSSIPKALVEIAVSEPEKLDELEKQAQG